MQLNANHQWKTELWSFSNSYFHKVCLVRNVQPQNLVSYLYCSPSWDTMLICLTESNLSQTIFLSTSVIEVLIFFQSFALVTFEYLNWEATTTKNENIVAGSFHRQFLWQILIIHFPPLFSISTSFSDYLTGLEQTREHLTRKKISKNLRRNISSRLCHYSIIQINPHEHIFICSIFILRMRQKLENIRTPV